MSKHPLSPPIFPAAWACDFGEDRYGLWMAFSYQGVRAALRWIQPGTFMMGSPEDEEGRQSNEVLHQVTLTQGFWMGETTVTQALWQAVMEEENLSHFKGDNLPVETVSWDDAQKFIRKLNFILQQHQPEYELRLPTEAEWEYACRAGTRTPFNFEDELSLNKVNYNGTLDSSIRWNEDSLQQTAIVKSYPCNAWGLYEMHGNVWEWCQDCWISELSNKIQINPIQQNDSPGRVLRGGSWGDNGIYARSAHRISTLSSHRLYYFGFRLAIGLQDK